MSALANSLSINTRQTILDAVKCIELGRLQIAFVVDDEMCLQGVVTNGDIRRYLLQNQKTDSPVAACMNKDFRFVQMGVTREELLKAFDLGHNAIPVLDGVGKLVDVYTKGFVATEETPTLARSKAPVRVSFGGGGADVTYFFMDNPASVLSCTIGLYAHATLLPRADEKINIYLEDLAIEECYDSLRQVLSSSEKTLLNSIVSVIRPKHGFDLYVRADFPVGSGLGGSSAVTTAVIAVFNEFRQDRWSAYEIAELAFQAERLCFGIAGGWQDQYASAFGGFNLIEFGQDNNKVHPVHLDEITRNELEACLLLCDTGISHDSGAIHKQQRKEITQTGLNNSSLYESVELCRKMHYHLIRGELHEFGRALDEAWRLKKNFSTAITDDHLDNIYNSALSAGALGGKLLGAGGGGFFLFYVYPQYRQAVVKAVSKLDCKIGNFRFESRGVTSWRAKI